MDLSQSPTSPKIRGDEYQTPKWVFPKIVVPPKSSIFNRVLHYKPSILGHHYLWKHPNMCQTRCHLLGSNPPRFFRVKISGCFAAQSGWERCHPSAAGPNCWNGTFFWMGMDLRISSCLIWLIWVMIMVNQQTSGQIFRNYLFFHPGLFGWGPHPLKKFLRFLQTIRFKRWTLEEIEPGYCHILLRRPEPLCKIVFFIFRQ